MDAVTHASLHVGNEIVADGGVGHVVHQDAVVVIVVGVVVEHGQLAALHQGVSGTGAPGFVVGDFVAVGKHVMDAVAHVAQAVAIDDVVVGCIDVDAVTHMPDLVVTDLRIAHGEKMQAVATVLGTHAVVALHLVGLHQHIAGGIHPDAKARTLQGVADDSGIFGGTLDKDAGIHVGQVLAPVLQAAVLDGYIRRTQIERVLLAVGMQDGTLFALQVNGHVHHEIADMAAGRQTPVILGHLLQRQGGDRLQGGIRIRRSLDGVQVKVAKSFRNLVAGQYLHRKRQQYAGKSSQPDAHA